MSDPRTIRPALACNGLEASAIGLKCRLLACELLPALDSHIDVLRQQLDRVADAAGDLAGDDGRTGAREWLIHALAGRGVVLDRALHAFHRLLSAVLEPLPFPGWNLPERR